MGGLFEFHFLFALAWRPRPNALGCPDQETDWQSRLGGMLEELR